MDIGELLNHPAHCDCCDCCDCDSHDCWDHVVNTSIASIVQCQICNAFLDRSENE